MRTPKYRRHVGSDIAFVQWDRKRHYLPGPFGSPESKSAYRQFIREVVFSDSPPAPESVIQPGDSPSITELVDVYLDFAAIHYGDDPRGEYTNMRHALSYLVGQFGDTPATTFGPKMLRTFRDTLASQRKGRGYINDTLGRVKRMFRWAVAEEIMPAAVLHALQEVSGLRAGKSQARESIPKQGVPAADVAAVVAEISGPVRDMILVAQLTGARMGSVCSATPGQFTQDPAGGPLWQWRPKHKTQHLGKELVLWVGPQCQAVLAPYMRGPADQPMFNPRASRKNARYRSKYSTNGIFTSIRRAIVRINARRAAETPPVPLMAAWSPHQLRHAKGRAVREQYGAEAAQAVLGHDSLDATQLYTERRSEVAKVVARETG